MSTIVPMFAETSYAVEAARLQVKVTDFAEVLDRFSIDRVRVCKMDCEGAELEILRSLLPETLRRVDAFAMEYHPCTYELRDLVDVIASWGDFHISKFPLVDTAKNHNLLAYKHEVLREWSLNPW